MRQHPISKLNLVAKNDNRRLDSFTRNTIDNIQRYFYDPAASGNVLRTLLNYLVGITLSDYAICLVKDREKSLEMTSESSINVLCATSDEIDLLNLAAIRSWMEQSKLTHPLFYNAPIPSSWSKVFKHPREDLSIMIVPVIVHMELRAIFILLKNNNPFSPYMLKRIKPALSATSCTIHSAETVISEFEGINSELYDQRFINNLISSSPTGIIIVDESLSIVNSNPMAQDIFYHVDASKDTDYNCPLSGYDIQQFIPNFKDLFKWSKQPVKAGATHKSIIPYVWHEVQGKNISGSDCLLDVTVFKHRVKAHSYTIVQIEDITAYTENMHRYQETTQQLHALTQLVPVGIIQVDNEWNCIIANEKWSEFTGLSEEESKDREWINAIHAEDIQETLDLLYTNLNLGNDFNKELRIVNTLGSITWVDFSIRVLFDTSDKVQGFLATFTDVTDRYVNQEKLRVAAEYDSLTGLTNRAKFQDRLEQALLLSERDDSIVNVFFLDLDGFKDVNDTFGHDAGDIVLQGVAERLVKLLRKSDTVSRFGGDEFVVLLGADDTTNDVINVAQKIISAVSEPYQVYDKELFLTTSLGIAQGNGRQYTSHELLKFADAALYRAKKEGKNKLEIYNANLDNENRERVMLLNELRYGLKDNKFFMVFQPVCNCSDISLSGFEALIRFTTNNGNVISPEKFIPLLEESNMILEVGRWIVDQVCCQMAMWRKQPKLPKNAYIAINVSAKELHDPLFFENLKSCTEKYDLPPENIVLEITESVLIERQEKVNLVLNEARKLGIQVAIDDFGTGYSSLSYLQKYPIDILKIDRSFIDDLSEGSNDTKITKSIIALADSLELKVVAEGVENESALSSIRKMGAQMVQGYHLSKPIKVSEVMDYLSVKH